MSKRVIDSTHAFKYIMHKLKVSKKDIQTAKPRERIKVRLSDCPRGKNQQVRLWLSLASISKSKCECAQLRGSDCEGGKILAYATFALLTTVVTAQWASPFRQSDP